MTRTTLTSGERQRAVTTIALGVAGFLLALAGCVTVIVIGWLTPDTTDASGILGLVWALIGAGVVLSVVLAALGVAVLARLRQRR
ncbi:MAG: hypothetical protein HOV83_38910 [Catenulispora sp.]|nr:hypothetical protein [Catenulispora sp.]